MHIPGEHTTRIEARAPRAETTRGYVSPELYEQHAIRVLGGKTLLTTEEVASIEAVSKKTVYNASCSRELFGWGRGRARRYPLWEVYRWACARRNSK